MGRSIWTSLLKFDPADGTTLLSKHVFDYREYWNFGFQELTLVDLTLSPGDQINTHCTYDTTKSGGEVDFGSDSSEEMCMSFLFYYPYEPTDGYFCGYVSPSSSLCGQHDVFGGANPVPDGDVSIPEELFVSYVEDGDGDGDTDSSNSKSKGSWIILLVSGVVFLGGVTAMVGFFYKRQHVGDRFLVLPKDSNSQSHDSENDQDKDNVVLLTSNKKNYDYI